MSQTMKDLAAKRKHEIMEQLLDTQMSDQQAEPAGWTLLSM